MFSVLYELKIHTGWSDNRVQALHNAIICWQKSKKLHNICTKTFGFRGTCRSDMSQNIKRCNSSKSVNRIKVRKCRKTKPYLRCNPATRWLSRCQLAICVTHHVTQLACFSLCCRSLSGHDVMEICRWVWNIKLHLHSLFYSHEMRSRLFYT